MIRSLVFTSMIGASLSVAASAQSEESLSRWKANMARHQQALMQGVPPPYATMRDTTPDSEAKMRRARALFDRNCSSCHGWSGQGTGPEGFFLVPAPADLEWLRNAPRERADPYLYWTIAEGGRAFDSEMPAYKDSLSRDDIWALTAYLRAGMPYASP